MNLDDEESLRFFAEPVLSSTRFFDRGKIKNRKSLRTILNKGDDLTNRQVLI